MIAPYRPLGPRLVPSHWSPSSVWVSADGSYVIRRELDLMLGRTIDGRILVGLEYAVGWRVWRLGKRSSKRLPHAFGSWRSARESLGQRLTRWRSEP